jgi:hypothetical protein
LAVSRSASVGAPSSRLNATDHLAPVQSFELLDQFAGQAGARVGRQIDFETAGLDADQPHAGANLDLHGDVAMFLGERDHVLERTDGDFLDRFGNGGSCNGGFGGMGKAHRRLPAAVAALGHPPLAHGTGRRSAAG